MEVDIFSSSKVLALFIELLSGLWQDNTGKIFLITFTAYAASYMIYSGYIAWFSGGYGGLPLSQMGFTVIDFLGLIPNAFLLIFELLFRGFKFFLFFFAIYFLLPIIVSYFAALAIQIIFKQPLPDVVLLLGMVLWIAGIFLCNWESNFISRHKKWLYVVFYILLNIGATLIMLHAQLGSTLNPTTNSSNPAIDIILLLLYELPAILLIVIAFVSPFLFGLLMGEQSLKIKLLSRVTRIIFNEPIQIKGKMKLSSLEIKRNLISAKSKLHQDSSSISIKPELFTYSWDDENPVYLLASFSKNTALYFPSDDNYKPGSLTVITNDCVRLIEVEGSAILKKKEM